MKVPKKSNHHSCDYKTNHDNHENDNHHQKSNHNKKAKLRQKSRSEKCFIQNSV